MARRQSPPAGRLRSRVARAARAGTLAASAIAVLAIAATGDALAAGSAGACPPPPPAIKNLDLQRYYSDKAGTVVDPELMDEHRDAVAPLSAFLRRVASDADKSIGRTSAKSAAEAGACAVSWIGAWAAQGAWLGTMASKQAEYQRKWDLAGVALAYLKVRRFAKPAQRAVIEPWLMRFADAARAFFDDPAHKRNNHWYWLGVGLTATALVTDSAAHWTAARGVMQDAATAIAADGTLPMELARQGRALQYHAFSLMPLVVMAELARSKGEDWYALSDGALHRLAATTMSGLADPARFDARAGTPQVRPVRPGAGWLQLYARHFPDRIPSGLPAIAAGHRWLGGDALLLARSLDIPN